MEIKEFYLFNDKGNEVTIHAIAAPSFITEVANFNNRSYPANCSFETDSEIRC